MSKTNCNAVRRELDEMDLGEDCSGPVTLHLQECMECRDFHQSRIKLRDLVGSLETVGAPPDFDFRLRARLANEKSGVAYGRTFAGWSLGTPSFVLGALLLLVGAVVGLNYWRTEPAAVAVDSQRDATPKPGTISAAVTPKRTDETVVAVAPPILPKGRVQSEQNVKGPSYSGVAVGLKPKRSLATRDFSLSAAQVVRREESMARAGVPGDFPINTTYQSLKVSLDDGSGNWRTISLPTVSFGSQRVLATGANQPATKGLW